MRQLVTILCLSAAATLTAQEAAEGNTFRLDVDDEASELLSRAGRMLKKEPEAAGRLLVMLLSRHGLLERERLVEYSDIVLPVCRACMRLFRRLPEGVRKHLKGELEALAGRALARLGEEEVAARFEGTEVAAKAAAHLAEVALERGDGPAALHYLTLIEHPDNLLFAIANALCGDPKPLRKILPSIPPQKRRFFAELCFHGKEKPSSPFSLADLSNIQNGPEGKEITSLLSDFGLLLVGSFIEPHPVCVDGTVWFSLPGGWFAYSPKESRKVYSLHLCEPEEGWLQVACWAETDGRFVVGLHVTKNPFVSCVDAKRKRLLWTSRDKKVVSDLRAVAPPVVGLGRVFWLGVKEGDKRASLWAVCQDVYGNLLWRRRLGSERWGRSVARRVVLGWRRRVVRRPWRAVGWVRLHGPYLFFVSGNGLAGSLETSNGRVQWLMTYPVVGRQSREPFPFMWVRPHRICQAPLFVKREHKGQTHWWFVFTPGDSDVLVGVRVDGRKWWWRRVAAWRYFAAMGDGILFVAERTPLYSRFEEGEVDTRVRLCLVDPATARLKFSKRLDTTAPPRGGTWLAGNLAGVVLGEELVVYGYDPGRMALERKCAFPLGADWILPTDSHALLFGGRGGDRVGRLWFLGRY